MLIQRGAFDQHTEMLLECVAAGAGQLDDVADGDAAIGPSAVGRAARANRDATLKITQLLQATTDRQPASGLRISRWRWPLR